MSRWGFFENVQTEYVVAGQGHGISHERFTITKTRAGIWGCGEESPGQICHAARGREDEQLQRSHGAHSLGIHLTRATTTGCGWETVGSGWSDDRLVGISA